MSCKTIRSNIIVIGIIVETQTANKIMAQFSSGYATAG